MDLDFITKWVEKNPTAFLYLFLIGGAIAIILSVFSRIKKNKQHKEALSKGGVAEIYFHETLIDAANSVMNGGLTYSKIFSVNGNKPNIIGHNLIVPVGQVMIELQYVQAGRGMMGCFNFSSSSEYLLMNFFQFTEKFHNTKLSYLIDAIPVLQNNHIQIYY